MRPFFFCRSYQAVLPLALLVALCGVLGLWQLKRGFEQKRRLAADPAPRHTLEGHFQKRPLFLLEHQIQATAQGRQMGFRVFVPFCIREGREASERTILVDLGWLPAAPALTSDLQSWVERRWAQFEQSPTGHSRLTGYLHPPRHPPFWMFGAMTRRLSGEVVRTHTLRLSDLAVAGVWPFPHRSGEGMTFSEEPPPPPTRTRLLKHWGYAGQWLMFACVLLWKWPRRTNTMVAGTRSTLLSSCTGLFFILALGALFFLPGWLAHYAFHHLPKTALKIKSTGTLVEGHPWLHTGTGHWALLSKQPLHDGAASILQYALRKKRHPIQVDFIINTQLDSDAIWLLDPTGRGVLRYEIPVDWTGLFKDISRLARKVTP